MCITAQWRKGRDDGRERESDLQLKHSINVTRFWSLSALYNWINVVEFRDADNVSNPRVALAVHDRLYDLPPPPSFLSYFLLLFLSESSNQSNSVK